MVFHLAGDPGRQVARRSRTADRQGQDRRVAGLEREPGRQGRAAGAPAGVPRSAAVIGQDRMDSGFGGAAAQRRAALLRQDGRRTVEDRRVRSAAVKRGYFGGSFLMMSTATKAASSLPSFLCQ